MTIADQLKKERDRCNLSLIELATKASLNIDTVKRIENGKHLNPTIEVLRMLGKALNNYTFKI
jgi:transcriptional regulator with XRE-family HTH domain